MTVSEKAVLLHGQGYNCAQAVLAACGEYTGMDEKTALAIAGGFGGGMRCGEMCGAVSGALMAIGLYCPYSDVSDTEAKVKIAKLAKELTGDFRDNFGCVRCLYSTVRLSPSQQNGVSLCRPEQPTSVRHSVEHLGLYCNLTPMSSHVFDSFLLEFLTCAQLLLGAGKGRLGDVVTAVHPRKLALASFKVEW